MNGIQAMVAQMLESVWRPINPARAGRPCAFDPYERVEAVRRIQAGESAADIARELGVRVQTVRNWVRLRRGAEINTVNRTGNGESK